MSTFTSRWLMWTPEGDSEATPRTATDKTDKTPSEGPPREGFVSYVSSIGGSGPTAADADPGVAIALDVFPDGRIVAVTQQEVWPPPGAWVPTPTRTIDPYAAEAPTSPCPICGARRWHKAGAGWTCGTCHPKPSPCADLGSALLELAARSEWPTVSLGPVYSVSSGEKAWRMFAAHAPLDMKRAALRALEALAPPDEAS
jgi:hypothetical protein